MPLKTGVSPQLFTLTSASLTLTRRSTIIHGVHIHFCLKVVTMSAKHSKAIKAYEFFRQAEQNTQVFTLEEIAYASGWSLLTTRTYRTKKWHFLLQEVEGGVICSGISNISQDAFIRIHAQKTELNAEILRPRFTPIVDVLIDKARESALLGVQIYNNPLISFRTPGFVVQMIIAFTSLFHATFERNGTDYWYTNADGTVKIIDGDKYAWDISECVKQYYRRKTTDVAENLRFFINIRNKIEHRFIPALDIAFSGKCQALLFNFEDLLASEFGSYFALGNNLALALQFSVYSSEQQRVLRKIQSTEYEAIRKYAEAYDANLPPEVTQSMNYSFRAYLIPKIANHANSADIAIEFIRYDPNSPEDMEKYEKQVAFIKEKGVQVADQGKLRVRDVVKRVKEATDLHFTTTHHTNAWKIYKVRPKGYSANGCQTEFCQFSEAFKDYVYTEAWVRFLIKKLQIPEEYNKVSCFRERNN